MKSNILAEVLSKHGKGKKDGDTISISDTQSITLYASLGGEALMVSDVTSVELRDETLLAVTSKGDLYAIATEDIRALRVAKAADKKRTGLIRG